MGVRPALRRPGVGQVRGVADEGGGAGGRLAHALLLRERQPSRVLQGGDGEAPPRRLRDAWRIDRPVERGDGARQAGRRALAGEARPRAAGRRRDHWSEWGGGAPRQTGGGGEQGAREWGRRGAPADGAETEGQDQPGGGDGEHRRRTEAGRVHAASGEHRLELEEIKAHAGVRGRTVMLWVGCLHTRGYRCCRDGDDQVHDFSSASAPSTSVIQVR
mmetsp:Transcript_14845/g.35335  ORF Transcript_14845/g.35335 Transcript_14845/m.35335 type:complete len:217 (+) Transcript_14845:67-717(+)